MTNLEQFMPNCFLPRQSSKLSHFFNGDLPSKNTNPTNTNQKTHVNQLFSGKFCSFFTFGEDE